MFIDVNTVIWDNNFEIKGKKLVTRNIFIKERTSINEIVTFFPFLTSILKQSDHYYLSKIYCENVF